MIVDAVLGQQRGELLDQLAALLDHCRAGGVVVGGRDPGRGPGVHRRRLPGVQQLPAAVDPELGHGRAFGGGGFGDAVVVAACDQDHPGVDLGLPVFGEFLEAQTDAVGATAETDLIEGGALVPGRDPARTLQQGCDLGLVPGDGLRPPAQVQRPPAVEPAADDGQDQDHRSPELQLSHRRPQRLRPGQAGPHSPARHARYAGRER